jgi:predicted secreted protein
MATYHGKDGVVKIGANAITEVKSFSVKTSAKVADDTVMGDDWETHIANKTVKSFSGSLACNHNPLDATGQKLLVAGASVTLKLYPIGNADGLQELEGTATITEVSVDPSKDATVPVSFSFQGNGALTDTVIEA